MDNNQQRELLCNVFRVLRSIEIATGKPLASIAQHPMATTIMGELFEHTVYPDLIEEFRALVESHAMARLKREGTMCEGNRKDNEISIRPGRLMDRIIAGRDESEIVVYVVDKKKGDICGTKRGAHGARASATRHGTLMTMHEYDWGVLKKPIKVEGALERPLKRVRK